MNEIVTEMDIDRRNLIFDPDWVLTEEERKELWRHAPDMERDGVKHKPVNFKQEYTELQLRELVRCYRSPIYFIENYFYTRHNQHGAMLMRVFPYQRNLIKAYFIYDRVIAMMPRQSGKSTTAAATMLWECTFRPNSFILVTSNKQAGADEIMRRLFFAYEELPWFLKPGLVINNVKTKSFDNGSFLEAIATTKDAGRGKSVTWLYMDEFAFVPPSIAEEFYTSIMPTLSTGGKCTITSTPNTDEDKFATIWFGAVEIPFSDKWVNTVIDDNDVGDDGIITKFANEEVEERYRNTIGAFDTVGGDKTDDGGDFYHRFYTDWRSVPDKITKDGKIISYRDESFKLKQLRGGLSPTKWKVEFECQFIPSSGTLISGLALANMEKTVQNPRFVDRHFVRWFDKPTIGQSYSVVLDPTGDGEDGDHAAIQVIELGTLRQVAEWNSRDATQVEQAEVLVHIIRYIRSIQERLAEKTGARLNDTIYYSVERNGVGIGVIRVLENYGLDRIPGYLVDSTETTHGKYGESNNPSISRYRGLLTTKATKQRFAYVMKDAIERGLFKVRSRVLASQLKTFVRKNNRLGAQEGTFDDLVMALILSFQLIEEVVYWEPHLDEMLTSMRGGEEEDDQPALPVFG